MPTDSSSFTINRNWIHVTRYGKGPRLLIVFHGFAESGKHYVELGKRLENEYTILIPDLPYHGDTKWKTGALSPAVLLELVQTLMRQEGVNRCSVMGYSMGGRPALCLAQEKPQFMEHLLLLAPEGLRKNHWFRFTTGTLVGNLLFRWTTFQPGFLLFLLKMSRYFGLISHSLAVFVKEHMNNTEKRLKVYHIWMCFRRLHVKKKRLYLSLQKSGLQVWLCLGRYDRLIPPQTADKIKPSPYIRVTVVESGHQLLLQEQVLNDIYTYLCRPDRT